MVKGPPENHVVDEAEERLPDKEYTGMRSTDHNASSQRNGRSPRLQQQESSENKSETKLLR